jgi:pimeloyl-ACP methyl ester carboxylesterase
MDAGRRWKRRLARLVLALQFAGSSSCMSFLHPVALPTPPCLQTCRELPPECRAHVHVFLINGLDPLRVGNLAGVRDHINHLGFANTYYGEMTAWSWFRREMKRVHDEDPGGRIVVIGYSAGASMAYHLAESLKAQGVRIDLLVYLDAKTFSVNFHKTPENVCRVLNVNSLSTIWCGSPIEGANNVFENDIWHFGPPSHPKTLKALADNLAALAATVADAPAGEGTAAVRVTLGTPICE